MIVPKTSWKKTLHLPKSTFPARAQVKDRLKYIKRCTDDLYAWQRARQLPKTFTVHDGPPYANGDLHIGHALNKILKDIICRSRLSEHVVDWRPGWDCHGLPIELKALQQQGARSTSNAVGIRVAAQKLAAKTVQDQKQAFRKWAIMADWDNGWTTMDRDFEIKQLNVFLEMVRKGLIYRRFKPVYWSPSSRTALAEAELEYRDDHVSTAAFVKFPLHTVPERLRERLEFGESPISIVIWTTTPWTLPANRAIGFHSGIEYTVASSASHGLLLVANSRLPEVEHHLNEILKPLASIEGEDLRGALYIDHVFASQSPPRPLLQASFVSETSGSGLVHLAPGHGMDDYVLCLHHNIAAFAPLDDKGCFTAAAYPDEPENLFGKEVLNTGNQAVLELLSQRGQLLGQHQYTHNYPYDWRAKQPIIVRATEQWFANVGSIQESALEALESVKFIPSISVSRLRAFVRNRSEWCISRQRAWGVPIPALYDSTTNEALLSDESVSHIISIIKERGVNAWWTDDEHDPAWTPASLRNSNGQTQFRRGKDTMDVWFDSGTSWTRTEQKSENDRHIADCYIEGTDQHRGWFQSSLLTHVAHHSDRFNEQNQAKAPFKTLITHGFTLDQDGRKMSKSVGNVISPDEIMEGTLLPIVKKKINGKIADVRDAMGPDALRLWVASCDYTSDVKISQKVLQAVNGTLSKYRVTFKLILGILEDFNPDSPVLTSNKYPTRSQEFGMVHQISLWRLMTVNSEVQRHYESFDFSRAVNEINRYVNHDLSSGYFEWIKDAAYCGTPKERVEVHCILYQIFNGLQQMLFPIVPLLIEEVWDYTPRQIKDYEKNPPGQRSRIRHTSDLSMDEQVRSDIPYLMEALATVKSTQELARLDKKMGDSLQSYVCIESESVKIRSLFERYDTEQLKILFGVSGVTFITNEASSSELRKAEWSYEKEIDLCGQKVRVWVHEPQLAKCVRCWRYAAPVEVAEAEALCERCEGVMENLKETKPELFV